MNRAFWGNTAVIGLLVVAAIVLGLWQHGHWWQAPPLPRTWLWAGLTVVLYALACAALRWARRPRHKDSLAPGSQAWLVAWASQTGYASELAELDAVRCFVDRLAVFTLAESLGGIESLIEHPGAMTHASTAGSMLEVPDDLVRLSVGIEDCADILADLEQALDALS